MWLSVALAASPSFDCAKAESAAEKLICSSPELSSLDATMAAAWKRAVKAVDRATLVDSQSSWLKYHRDPCTEIACMRASYARRIGWLTELPHRPKGTNTNFTGHYLRSDGARLDVVHRLDGRLTFQLVAIWNGGNDNIHVGEATAELPVSDNGVRFVDGKCTLAIQFSADHAGITQQGDDGDCGFGAYVSAEGDYSRIDRTAPLLDPDGM